MEIFTFFFISGPGLNDVGIISPGSTTISTAAPGSVTTTAPGSVTTTAPGGVTTTAPGGVTTTAPGGVTTTAPAGVTTTAPGGVTTTPPAGVTTTPPGGVTTTPPAGVTTTPGVVTTTAPGGVTTTPPAGVTTTPPGVTTTPPGVVTTTPPGVVTTTPPGVVTTTPPGVVTTTPPGGVTTTPPGGATTTPPGVVTTTPPGVVTTTPPAGVTTTPPGVTTTPPGVVTTTPPGVVTTTPPGGVTTTPPGGATTTSPSGVTTTPPGDTTTVVDTTNLPTTPALTTEEPTTIFIAIISGEFTDPTIWAGGVVPFGRCSINITAGVTVTFTGAVLDIEIVTFHIYGTFTVVSSGGLSFRFGFTFTFIVYGTGSFTADIDNSEILCLADSVFLFYPGGSFSGSSTTIIKYVLEGTTIIRGETQLIGSSFVGPFTCGILLDGTIKVFLRFTFIVRQSGSFSATATWLTGFNPTAAICSAVGGCGIYIPTGIILDTQGLGGILSINITIIIVERGARFVLIPSLENSRFTFRFSFVFEIYGTLEFRGSLTVQTGGIYVVGGTDLNFYEGGAFESNIFITLFVYNIVTNEIIGTGVSWGLSFFGPRFFIILIDGTITETTARK